MKEAIENEKILTALTGLCRPLAPVLLAGPYGVADVVLALAADVGLGQPSDANEE